MPEEQFYTAMYGERYGFYEFFTAENDNEAVRIAEEFMQSSDYQRLAGQHRTRILARTGLRTVEFHLYQVLQGKLFEDPSNHIVWDCYNGMLAKTNGENDSE